MSLMRKSKKTTGKQLETREFRYTFKDLEELVAFSPLTDRKVQVPDGFDTRRSR